jgi:2-oxo-hept-3-ene-1,7-dioate hydratase
VSAVLYRNETIEESGVAAAVLGNPAMGVAWLANKLARHGEKLQAGEIVLAGSFTRPIWVRRGDIILGDYRDLGAVSCRFV